MLLEGLQKNCFPVHEFRLGDIEDTTLRARATVASRTFIRTMVSKDQSVTAEFYHVRPKSIRWRIAMFLMRAPNKIVEFQTRTSCGQSYFTAAVPPSFAVPRPPPFHRDFAPAKTPLGELYGCHLRTLEQQAHEALIAVENIDDVIELENSESASIYKHLEEISWASRDHLLKQGVSRKIVGHVYRELKRQVRVQRGIED
jgi:hypothetical protein